MTERTLLLRHATLLATMDDAGREIADGGVYITDGVITAVGPTDTLPDSADEIIDLSGHVVMPGLVNTHHHMFQSLTRAVPAAQDAELFDWLSALYPIWQNITPPMIGISTQLAMAELILSGCTTSSDHLYLYPNGCRLDDSIEAAAQIGMRFHATRGGMSVGRSAGGLPPDFLVETESGILRDSQRVIEQFHDPQRHAMLRIALAPCSPFSVTQDLMRQTAHMARHYGVSLHTHLAENDKDVAYTRERFNCTPAEYAEELGWVGHDVWHAHCVQLDDPGIALFARTHTGIAHCPCSNMRLASGIAPIRRMCEAGVKIGLGVDGSASNDRGHLLDETRQAMLLARVLGGPAAMSARTALRLATRGGASVLNRDDIGMLAPGMSADIVAWRLDGVGMAGGWHDPLAALLFCQPGPVALSIINGRVIARDGQIQTIDLHKTIAAHNVAARELLET
jgi:cytosine/adenosine deaminase-related metal-dependent hydrolase